MTNAIVTALLKQGNAALFKNDGQHAEKNKIHNGAELVKADLSYWIKGADVNLNALVSKSKDGTKDYYRVTASKKDEQGKFDYLNGSLFKVQEKKSEKAPDYWGNFEVKEGNDYVKVIAVSGWKKKDKNGKAYISLNFQEPNQQSSSETAAAPAAASEDDDDLF